MSDSMNENPEFLAYFDVVKASIISLLGSKAHTYFEQNYREKWLMYFTKRKFDKGWDVGKTAKEWCNVYDARTKHEPPTLDQLIAYQKKPEQAYHDTFRKAKEYLGYTSNYKSSAGWKRLPVVA